MNYALAVDIGASSGRHIVGWMQDGQIQTEEVYRFANGVQEKDGHLTWDVDHLFSEVKNGLREALKKYPAISTLSIDAWGVDYVLLKGDEPVFPCYAYRDNRTQEAIEAVHAILPFETLYEHTGIQFQTFNTIYQLYADLKANRLQGVTDFLMMPEYLLWKLTGVKKKEYTNATTGGLVCAKTNQYDMEIVRALGLPEHLFAHLYQPGEILGDLLPEVQQEVGGNVQAVLCATHDTGSAVEGIPMTEDSFFLSSGTWSLLGVKIPTPVTTQESLLSNFSNEGGVGYIRYLKNIMGMWLVNRLRDELCPNKNFSEIVAEAESDSFDETVEADDLDFLAPQSMKAAFDSKLHSKPKTSAGYFRCAYQSLALAYQKTIQQAEKNIGKTYEKLYIVGGGAKNKFLNRLTEEATGKKVIALPIEATAIGNLKIQLEGHK